MELKDLNVGDVVKLQFSDSFEVNIESVSIVSKIENGNIFFTDLVMISDHESDYDWSPRSSDTVITEFLFHHKSAKEVLFEKFPEYSL